MCIRDRPTLEDFGSDVWWIVLIKIVGIFVVLVFMTLFAIVFERKVVARMQQRVGPNRVGWRGYLQSLADGLKLAFKEDIMPALADKPVYFLAPVIATIPAFLAFSVIPLGPEVSIFGHYTPLQLTDAPIGVLVVLALPTPEAARAELAALGSSRRPAEGIGLDVRPPAAPDLPAGETAVLASWRQLFDAGTLQRDEPELAGTARQPVVRINAGAAQALGVVDGDRVTVSGATGSVSLPVRITAMPDQVVWLPMRSPGSEIRADLGSGPGGVVRLSVTGETL